MDGTIGVRLHEDRQTSDRRERGEAPGDGRSVSLERNLQGSCEERCTADRHECADRDAVGTHPKEEGGLVEGDRETRSEQARDRGVRKTSEWTKEEQEQRSTDEKPQRTDGDRVSSLGRKGEGCSRRAPQDSSGQNPERGRFRRPRLLAACGQCGETSPGPESLTRLRRRLAAAGRGRRRRGAFP